MQMKTSFDYERSMWPNLGRFPGIEVGDDEIVIPRAGRIEEGTHEIVDAGQQTNKDHPKCKSEQSDAASSSWNRLDQSIRNSKPSKDRAVRQCYIYRGIVNSAI